MSMKIIKILFPILSLSLLVSSCCQKKVYCTSGYLDFAFTGFVRNEVRSFTLRRYAKGDQFGPVIDSAQFIYYGTAPVRLVPDTLPLSDYKTVGELKGITADNDWAIYLPVTGKVFYITSVFDNQNKSEMVKCGNYQTHCTRDIANFSISNIWKSGNYIYIQKGEY